MSTVIDSCCIICTSFDKLLTFMSSFAEEILSREIESANPHTLDGCRASLRLLGQPYNILNRPTELLEAFYCSQVD